jgi:K+-sensing histidine kinase KdpD
MKDKFADLINVKTIVTFVVTAVFAYLAAIGRMEIKDFMLIAVMVFTYFFSKPATAAENTRTTETTTSVTTLPPKE